MITCRLFSLSIIENPVPTFNRKNIIVNIIPGIMVLYILLMLWLLAAFIPQIIEETLDRSGTALIRKINSWLICYIGFDLILRFISFSIPELLAKPYLLLPVSRRQLSRFLMINSLLTGFNLIPFIFFSTLCIAQFPHFNHFQSLTWYTMVLSLIASDNFLNFIIKRYVNEKTCIVVLAGFLFVAAGLADFSGILHLSTLSETFFPFILDYPIISLAWLALLAEIYYVNYKALISRIFLDLYDKSTSNYETRPNYSFFRRFRTIGELLAPEIKLIFRQRRTRASLIMMPFLLLYGLLFYTYPVYKEKTGWLFLPGYLLQAHS